MPETADLDAIFGRLERSVRRYAPPLAVRTGSVRGKRDCQLWSEKAVEVARRRRDEVFFAGLIVQKGYVGFYFMPVHTHAERTAVFSPELLTLLRGKSCFHVKRLDDELEAHVEAALATGFELYRERGWVE